MNWVPSSVVGEYSEAIKMNTAFITLRKSNSNGVEGRSQEKGPLLEKGQLRGPETWGTLDGHRQRLPLPLFQPVACPWVETHGAAAYTGSEQQVRHQ